MKKYILFWLGPLLCLGACNKPGDCVECFLVKNTYSASPETLRTYSGCWPRIQHHESKCYDDASLLNTEGNASYSCSCKVTKADD